MSLFFDTNCPLGHPSSLSSSSCPPTLLPVIDQIYPHRRRSLQQRCHVLAHHHKPRCGFCLGSRRINELQMITPWSVPEPNPKLNLKKQQKKKNSSPLLLPTSGPRHWVGKTRRAYPSAKLVLDTCTHPLPISYARCINTLASATLGTPHKDVSGLRKTLVNLVDRNIDLISDD